MSLSNELDKLDELHRRGALSDDEFARAKARVLGGSGSSTASAPALGAINSFRRSRNDRWFGGVCGGLAASTDAPAWLWRLVFVAVALCGGTGVVAYVLLWIVLPLEDGVVDGGTGSFRTS